MKSLLTILLAFAAFTTMAQDTDENGRPVGARPAQVVNSTMGPSLQKNATSTSTDYKLNYSLPQGQSTGSIKLFDARRDQELKSFDITSTTGVQSINLKEYNGRLIVAGLYNSEGKFLSELRLK